MQIHDSHILITGASRGIGRAIAEQLAAEGAHLYLVSRARDQQFIDRCLSLGAKSVSGYAVDLADAMQVRQFLLAHAKLPIDILFNNAGVLTGGTLETQCDADIEAMLQVNLHALVQTTRAFLPGMLARGRGKIVNHASLSAVLHFPGASTYAASKAAVLAFSNCLRLELAKTPVSTLVLVSPFLQTEMFGEVQRQYAAHMNTDALKPVAVDQYAIRIRRAIPSDAEILEPQGKDRFAVWMARYLPRMMERLMCRSFHR